MKGLESDGERLQRSKERAREKLADLEGKWEEESATGAREAYATNARRSEEDRE